MNNEIPTVRIKSDNPFGYAIINESDFNPDEHELFDESPTDGESDTELADLLATAVAVEENETEENPDQPQTEQKSRKRRQSVET